MDISGLTRGMRKALPLKYCGAVIVAGGSASRMQGVDKIMADLGGMPVIARTVQAFQDCEAVSEIVIAAREDQILPITQLCQAYPKVTAVVRGGSSRQESVGLGLNALSKRVRLAAIHDGARPLASPQMIDRVIRAANTYGAAIPAVAVKDTVKTVSGGVVGETLNRDTLRAAQTPQVFDYDLLRGALKKAAEAGISVTDDASAVEQMGMTVKVVAGEERNIKITTPLDLKIAAMLLEETI